MTIINYQEFTATFNDLFENASIRDVQDFGYSALKSKERRKKNISLISKEIKISIQIEIS